MPGAPAGRLGAAVRQHSPGFIAAVAHFSSKAVVEAWVIMQRHFGMPVQPGVDRGLRLGTDEVIGGGDVEHQRIGDGVALAQHLVDHHPVIADRGIDIGPRRGHIGEPPAQAVSRAADLGDAFAAPYPVDRRLDVVNPVGRVELAEIAERFLQLLGHIRIELDSGSEAPEDVRRHREIALGCPAITLGADPWIDPEDLRDHDNRRLGCACGPRDIGGDRLAAVERGDLDHIGHG
jgi:hypothetical protein